MKKFIPKIMEFFKNLFDKSTNTDEKIVVGFMSFGVMIFIALIELFTKFTVDFDIFSTFALLTFACFGLGTYSSVKALNTKQTVASEIVKNDASQDSNLVAKDIVQAEKPE